MGFEEGGDSRDSELRSEEEGNEVEASVTTEDCWLSGGGDGNVSCGALRARRWRWTSASTRERTSDSNFFWSFSVSSWTRLSISKRANTSHSRRTVASMLSFIISCSIAIFASLASSS